MQSLLVALGPAVTCGGCPCPAPGHGFPQNKTQLVSRGRVPESARNSSHGVASPNYDYSKEEKTTIFYYRCECIRDLIVKEIHFSRRIVNQSISINSSFFPYLFLSWNIQAMLRTDICICLNHFNFVFCFLKLYP